ncbi:hypothetical protein [Paraburkholderia bannensis]|uniref:hypothetical protein n=1 Tax=Paraburkholderia bannensis TaxID=765414 RepID=UPI002AAFFDD4|nr:hypothetical protein [Paraburkholderia bannensis]
MEFSISYTPVSTRFSSMSQSELKAFYEWFMRNLPYSIEELRASVRNSCGFENWEADDTPRSLETLGDWLSGNVGKRSLSAKERGIIERVSNQFQQPHWDLTDETKSLVVAVGMYYGEVAIKNLPALKWEQLMGSKRQADFGQPVVAGEGVVPINPVRVAHAFACGLINGTRERQQLREAYDYWTSRVAL